ncbi:hypothetical protein [Streptomyces sp. NPDC051546]|uniref:hypothetical protein n=1 Tax=Streptomyces sp. NPDC051546 TaxID=3365655 RepID=UPI0037ACA8B2
MVVAIEVPSSKRERGTIPVPDFSFHREYINHDRFEVTISDGGTPFVYEVRAWGNMIRTVTAFAESIAHLGVCQRTRVDIYRTGYALVNGANIRVTALS